MIVTEVAQSASLALYRKIVLAIVVAILESVFRTMRHFSALLREKLTGTSYASTLRLANTILIFRDEYETSQSHDLPSF